MGVCAQQHRVMTGMYNSILLKTCTNNLVDETSVTDALILTISVVGLILYLYILCLLMAVCVEIPHCSVQHLHCLLYTSPSPRDGLLSRMPSSA